MIIDNQTVVLNRVTAWDKYKDPVGYKDYPMQARVTNEINRTTNPAGEEVVTTLTVLLKTSELKQSRALRVLYDDKITYTDEFGNSVSRVPQSIGPARGFSGNSSFVRVLI